MSDIGSQSDVAVGEAAAEAAPPRGRVRYLLRTEWPLAITILTACLFGIFGDRWFADLSSAVWLASLAAWLFVVVMLAAFGVERQAEALAVRLGEPLGTLVLTLSVISIEVMMISAVMLHGADNPTLARDAMYSVVMIVLNGLVGLCLLLGGLRHREQEYNLQGANAFLALILPLAIMVLILPAYTRSTADATLTPLQSAFMMGIALGLYAVFVGVETVRHRSYFMAPRAEVHAEVHREDHMQPVGRAAMLLCYLLPVVLLSKKLAVPIDYTIDRLGAPSDLAGLLVAILVLSPEGLGAVRAALKNHLQRAVNISLGSAAATIGLTVPSVLAIGLLTGNVVILGLQAPEAIMLTLTLLVSILTFSSGRTNILQGAVHLVLFSAYVVFLFD